MLRRQFDPVVPDTDGGDAVRINGGGRVPDQLVRAIGVGPRSAASLKLDITGRCLKNSFDHVRHKAVITVGPASGERHAERIDIYQDGLRLHCTHGDVGGDLPPLLKAAEIHVRFHSPVTMFHAAPSKQSVVSAIEPHSILKIEFIGHVVCLLMKPGSLV